MLWALIVIIMLPLMSSKVAAENAVDPCASEKGRINSWLHNSNLHQTIANPDQDNFKFNTICDFNAWSWQMFMWLTQNVKQDAKILPRFLSNEFMSPYELLGIANRETLTPVAPGHDEVFDEVFQAGSDGILIDKNGRAVYYSQYLNKTFTDFISNKKLTDPKAVQAFPATTTFPVNTLEIKTSWRIVQSGEDTNDVYTMHGKVYGLTKKNNKIVIDTNNIIDTELALVGFHIGGVVPNHPEMIWATFEQIQNSPIVPSKFNSSTVISDNDYKYTFFNQNPEISSPPTTNTYASCNINYIKSPYLTFDESSQKFAPTAQVCLQYSHGNSAVYKEGPTEKANATMQKNIEENDNSVLELNAIVRSKLRKDNINTVWANYRMIGAIWFKGNNLLKPNMSLATDFDANGKQLLIGSVKLSNSTIETFTQYASTENNCFRCHNTQQRFITDNNGKALEPLKGMNLSISHAFVNIYTWSQMMAENNTAHNNY
jgi:hypothetical protein